MGLQKLDALLLSDLNLVAGVHDLKLCDLFQARQTLRVVIYARIAVTLVALALLIYCFAIKSGGQHPGIESVAVILLIVAAGIFAVTRFKLKELAAKHDNQSKLSSKMWIMVVYISMYLMPVASFLQIGVALTLDPIERPVKALSWAIQLIVKSICALILVAYAAYYKVYAEAWHCYKHESELSDYKHGYCPSYTHQGSFLAPGNVMCRPGHEHSKCYGDRTAEEIPRRWLSHGRWTYALVVVILHITVAQAIEGINGVRALFKHARA